MRADRPKNTRQRTWSRFRIATVVLFFSGVRVSEAGIVTLEMLEKMKQNQRCEFFQPKVNTNRICHFPKTSIPYFKAIENDIDIVFDPLTPEAQKAKAAGFTLTLYPFISTSKDKWIALINIYLRYFFKEFNLKLTSHSFRISYITRILGHSSVDRAQKFVGHKDIRSTMTYSQYQVGDKKSLDILDTAFEE